MIDNTFFDEWIIAGAVPIWSFFSTPGGTAAEKALAVNLDSKFYGSFAEIGAGQEVWVCIEMPVTLKWQAWCSWTGKMMKITISGT